MARENLLMAEKNPSALRPKPDASKPATVAFDLEHLLAAAISWVITKPSRKRKNRYRRYP